MELSLNNTLISVETALSLDYGINDDIDDVIANAKSAIERKYGIELTTDVITLQNEAAISSNGIHMFMQDLRGVLSQLALYTCCAVFDHNPMFSLDSVNYFGFDKSTLLTYFRYLLDRKLYEKNHEAIVDPFKAALANIPYSEPRRLLVVLLMFEALGFPEGTAITTQLLLIGGF